MRAGGEGGVAGPSPTALDRKSHGHSDSSFPPGQEEVQLCDRRPSQKPLALEHKGIASR